MQTFRLRRMVVQDEHGFLVRISATEAHSMGLGAGDQVEISFEPDADALERIPTSLQRF